MAKETKKKIDVEKIISKQMPNYRVVNQETAEAPSAPAADSVSPTLAAMKKKYAQRSDSPRMSADSQSNESVDLEEIDQVVVVEPKSADAAGRGPGQKVVMISKDGRIVGQQG